MIAVNEALWPLPGWLHIARAAVGCLGSMWANISMQSAAYFGTIILGRQAWGRRVSRGARIVYHHAGKDECWRNGRYTSERVTGGGHARGRKGDCRDGHFPAVQTGARGSMSTRTQQRRETREGGEGGWVEGHKPAAATPRAGTLVRRHLAEPGMRCVGAGTIPVIETICNGPELARTGPLLLSVAAKVRLVASRLGQTQQIASCATSRSSDAGGRGRRRIGQLGRLLAKQGCTHLQQLGEECRT